MVINCAAWTAVDAAEASAKDCYAVNADAVYELATICNEIDSTLVQISTDYVYGKNQTRSVPYTETDIAGPINQYGVSKLAGEEAASQASDHLIIRTSGLYSASEHGPVRGRNFADTMLCLSKEFDELRIVSDQHCTPSFVPHVASGTIDLMQGNARGLYNVVNMGSTTWHEFTLELLQAAGIEVPVSEITTDEYPTIATRPRFCVLNTHKFTVSTGRSLPHWKTGIAEYVRLMKPHLTRMEQAA